MRVQRAVLGQIDWWWKTIFRPRLEGLTDEEYFWEPVPESWTLRPDANGLYFHEWPPQDRTPPVTTIAWRMAHIGVGCLANRTITHFEPGAGPPWMPFPGDAAGAVAFLEEWFGRWRRGLESAGEEALWRPIGPAEGDIATMQLAAEDPLIGLILHVHREVMHHGAEINLLRDIYRATHEPDPAVATLVSGDRAAIERLGEEAVARARAANPSLLVRVAGTGNAVAVRLLAGLGFDVNAGATQRPLHAAAGAGHLDVVKALAELGADLDARDVLYDTTPLGWAQFFGQGEVAEYLSELSSTTTS